MSFIFLKVLVDVKVQMSINLDTGVCNPTTGWGRFCSVGVVICVQSKIDVSSVCRSSGYLVSSYIVRRLGW